ncbi:MAG TPA: hypothetical protein VFZ48_02470 [Candidatus Saccharimonadales bacterium]
MTVPACQRHFVGNEAGTSLLVGGVLNGRLLSIALEGIGDKLPILWPRITSPSGGIYLI